jgi:hypothetical protein
MWKRRILATLILIVAPLSIAGGDCDFDFGSDDCEVFCFDD